MTATFPGAVKIFVNKIDNFDDVMADDINQAYDEITTTQTEIFRRRDTSRTFTEHFEGAALPDGWTIQSSGGFTTFTPDFATNPSLLRTSTLSSGSVYYVTRASAPSTFPVFIACGWLAGYGFIGYRIDDGSDDNYVETGLFVNSSNVSNRRIRYRTGGGAVTTVDSTDTITLPNGFIILKQISGTQWSSWGSNTRWQLQWGFTGVQSVATIGPASLTWTPTRLGIILRPDATAAAGIDSISY